MTNEYYAVILEFNSQIVKLGFAHEAKEHVRITPESPTWSKYIRQKCFSQAPAFLGLSSHCIDESTRNSLLLNASNDPKLKDMIQQYQQDQKRLRWYNWEEDHFESLAQTIRYLISTSLMITPTKSKLFLVDSGLSVAAKRQFCEAIFKHQASTSVSFLPHAVCLAIASGVRDAMVVDVNWNLCKVSCLIDLRIVSFKEFVDFSHESVHYAVAMTEKSNVYKDIELLLKSLSELGNLNLADFALEKLPLELANMIKKIAVDSRLPLASNIIMTGFLGSGKRLQEAILKLTSSFLQTMTAQGVETLSAWAGASIYCSTILLNKDYDDWKHMQISQGQLETEQCVQLERHGW